MECYDDQQWNQNCAEMLALREKRGDADPTKNIEIDILKTFDLATYPNIARRLRAAKSDYNQALKQLTQLQRQRRLEAAEKAKQAKESDRQANKTAQETQDRSTRSGPPPHPTGFVPATAEAPPETPPEL